MRTRLISLENVQRLSFNGLWRISKPARAQSIISGLYLLSLRIKLTARQLIYCIPVEIRRCCIKLSRLKMGLYWAV